VAAEKPARKSPSGLPKVDSREDDFGLTARAKPSTGQS
jgi:hypothetical protein